METLSRATVGRGTSPGATVFIDTDKLRRLVSKTNRQPVRTGTNFCGGTDEMRLISPDTSC
jgi:hypothetical protein